jgi:hypothetical protein
LHHVDCAVDVGPGIRPQDLVWAQRRICIEPYGPYVEWLRSHGYTVVQGKAVDVLSTLNDVDTVIALDVIEHMERSEGETFIEQALNLAKSQVVIFTPWGFMEQTGDAWGMGGDYWQEHRSGWTPDDFAGWTIVPLFGFHDGRDAFYAVHG